MTQKRIVVAITGASGVIYGIHLLKALLAQPIHVFLTLSDAGKKVLAHENGYPGGDFKEFLFKQGVSLHQDAALNLYEPDNLFAPPASGSFRHHGMVIAPCSMKTLGAIAAGIAEGLIHRAADVTLKEKRPLILLTRETPLNLIHLKNMLTAAQAGAAIMPACPGFYGKANTVDELVDGLAARILDHLGIEQMISKEWGI